MLVFVDMGGSVQSRGWCTMDRYFYGLEGWPVTGDCVLALEKDPFTSFRCPYLCFAASDVLGTPFAMSRKGTLLTCP